MIVGHMEPRGCQPRARLHYWVVSMVMPHCLHSFSHFTQLANLSHPLPYSYYYWGMSGDTLQAEHNEEVDYEGLYDDEGLDEGDLTNELETSVATGDLGQPGRLTGCGCRLAWPTLDALCMLTCASAWIMGHSRAQWCDVFVWCVFSCGCA